MCLLRPGVIKQCKPNLSLPPSFSSPLFPHPPPTLWGDEVSTLTHTYPHKPMTKISDHMQYKPNLSLPPSPTPTLWGDEVSMLTHTYHIPTQTLDNNQSDHMQSPG